jgi:hypothetical protein
MNFSPGNIATIGGAIGDYAILRLERMKLAIELLAFADQCGPLGSPAQLGAVINGSKEAKRCHQVVFQGRFRSGCSHQQDGSVVGQEIIGVHLLDFPVKLRNHLCRR